MNTEGRSERFAGVSAMKASFVGTPLPSARLVSTTVNMPEKDPGGQAVGNCFTTLHMTFGQFLDHDIAFTPVNAGDNGTTITCCSPEVIKNPTLLHPECAPIDIPLDDPFYSAFGETCMEFVRSAPADRCKLGPREQLNQRTHYIDLSTIYGSTDEEATSLRKNQHGLLRTQDQGADPDLLPPSLNRDDDCNTEDNFAKGQFCFVAGDDRVNELILLTLLHTIWVREHNRIALALKQLNPSWNDERLYQEARRINIAEMQHITYNEFLPGVLGPLVVEWLGLAPKKHGEFTNNYDPNISVSISSEFATAALRFGHSMIPSSLHEVNSAGVSQAKELNSVLFAPFPLYENGREEKLVRGETSQPAMKVDSKFTSQVTGKLFRGSQSFGLDLVALNIQRGRDHGLASYITVREACGFSRVATFDDLVPFMVSKSLESLRKIYKRVEDIELFVGGVSEKPVAGGQVGPTFACILGEQFIRLKRGDRFWYENSGSPNPFTREQLSGLQEVSLARILCDNHPQSASIQRWPLNLPNPFNRIVSCDCPIIPSLNLAMWKE
ncbi:hypothetical protein Pcinc_014084 [Petrolisthes cinctipes]|uniref:Peroxidase n=1 Tax=Petrolisthes cinctipes TaxID=88211 RepID=A0AAE1FVN7_PETCI|nr:hypothetical protein Pcinc_014084 [Petrolisthes cinctipes]